jgi:hypothetical protein
MVVPLKNLGAATTSPSELTPIEGIKVSDSGCKEKSERAHPLAFGSLLVEHDSRKNPNYGHQQVCSGCV